MCISHVQMKRMQGQEADQQNNHAGEVSGQIEPATKIEVEVPERYTHVRIDSRGQTTLTFYPVKLSLTRLFACLKCFQLSILTTCCFFKRRDDNFGHSGQCEASTYLSYTLSCFMSGYQVHSFKLRHRFFRRVCQCCQHQ